MTIELEQSLPKRSEIKSEDYPTPTLDLIGIQSLAEEILQAPGAGYVGKLAEQIMADCDYADMAYVLKLADAIRGADDPGRRAPMAAEIISIVSGMIDARSAALDAAINSDEDDYYGMDAEVA